MSLLIKCLLIIFLSLSLNVHGNSANNCETDSPSKILIQSREAMPITEFPIITEEEQIPDLPYQCRILVKDLSQDSRNKIYTIKKIIRFIPGEKPLKKAMDAVAKRLNGDEPLKTITKWVNSESECLDFVVRKYKEIRGATPKELIPHRSFSFYFADDIGYVFYKGELQTKAIKDMKDSITYCAIKRKNRQLITHAIPNHNMEECISEMEATLRKRIPRNNIKNYEISGILTGDIIYKITLE